MPSQKLPGRELPDWVFDPLSSSWVSRDSENICWVRTTRQTDFKRLGPRLEVPYLSGNRFLFTSTKPNFQHHRMRSGKMLSSFACTKLTLVDSKWTAHPGYFICTQMPVCEHEQCADKPDQVFQMRIFSPVVPDWAIVWSIYKMLRKPSSSHALSL